MKGYQAIIIGRGLAGLTAAMRLTELGVTDILLAGQGLGGTPAIAAINFVLPENPAGDTPHAYVEDMITAGYGLGNRELVEDMARRSADAYALLVRAGVQFACQKDGTLVFRRLSGHSCARSLCQTNGLIGKQMAQVLQKRLMQRGVTFTDRVCVRLLSDGERVYGVTLLDEKHFNQLDNVYAPVVIAAWGGVGRLFEHSTYPADVNGRTIAMAYNAGAELVDLEFVEYEPMVVVAPAGVVGEPCPTAMLGEGAYLLNAKGERFLLQKRPQGEAGAPKSLINRMIWQQVKMGVGSPKGGCWVDMRHLPVQVLQGYPWFYNRIKAAGIDPQHELLEVAPMAHSFSGGVRVDRQYRSSLAGLYAVGEAAGGVHGACRCAGNAASQAVVSGMICAETVANSGEVYVQLNRRFPCEHRIEPSIFERYAPRIREVATRGLSVYRSKASLTEALTELETIQTERPVQLDGATSDLCLTVRLLLRAALARRESRGVHLRIDAPDMSDAFAHSLVWGKGRDEV